MKTWHRSEPETIRPFFEVRGGERALDHAAIVRRPGEDPQYGPVVPLEDHEWEEIAPRLRPSIDAASLLSALAAHADAFELALLVRDPTFKKRGILGRWKVTGTLPEEIEISRTWLEEFGHGREIHLTLAVCLASPLPEAPGVPSVLGSWVCQKTFELRPSRLQSQFPVEELTADLAQCFGVDPGALLFVDYRGDINAIDESGSPVACAYVNSDIYRRLTSGARSDPLLSLLEAEIVAGVILAASEDIEDVEEVVDDGPLDRILKNLSGSDPMPLDELKRMLAHTQAPQKVRAAVFGAIGSCLKLSKV
jgi:hypothetical protein